MNAKVRPNLWDAFSPAFFANLGEGSHREADRAQAVQESIDRTSGLIPFAAPPEGDGDEDTPDGVALNATERNKNGAG